MFEKGAEENGLAGPPDCPFSPSPDEGSAVPFDRDASEASIGLSWENLFRKENDILVRVKGRLQAPFHHPFSGLPTVE